MTESDTGTRSARELAAGHMHVVMYGDLRICGCGNPEEAYALVKDMLTLVPYLDGDNWQRVNDLIGTPGAVHLDTLTLDDKVVLARAAQLGYSVRELRVIAHAIRGRNGPNVKADTGA